MPHDPRLQEWLDDLRDPANQSKQGTTCLQVSADRFCCLGRLCLVAERHGVYVDRTATGRVRGRTLLDQPRVDDWARSFMAVEHGIEVSGHNVAEYNDDSRKTFAQIADSLDPPCLST